MEIKSASFENFRNITKFDFEFDPRMNIIFGKNAQGKTNVIEGIYLFAGGKSFRHAKDADMKKFGEEYTKISVNFSTSERNYDMAINLRPLGRRELLRNGAKVKKLSDFVGTFRAVLFCPSHLSIVQAEPSTRRSFIDGAISQFKPRYLSSLIEYGKVLEQRNALLRSYEDKPEGFDLMYEVLSEKIAVLGGYITAVRNEYLFRVFSHVDALISDMSKGCESVGYEYVTSISGEGELSDEKTNAELYRKKISRMAEKEKIVGTSLVGAHRDDFLIKLSDKEAKIFASQGQQRSIALALKLAEGEISREECGEYPVFLLDDVLSELDRDRKNYVLSQLFGRQVIITSCDENDFSDIDGGKKIFVDGGVYKYV